jgi:cell division GTPase FtsZ
MTLGEAEAAVTAISRSIAPDAHIIWGATVDDGIKNRGVRVLAVLSGVREKQVAQTTSEAVENIDFI